jgi:hypothetical protein
VSSPAVKAGRAFGLVVAYFTTALLGGWLLKRQIFFTAALAKLPVLLLLIVNMIFVFSGIPLSAVGDLLLLKKVGVIYLLYWPFFVAMASCVQIFFFRSPFCHAWASPLAERLRRRSKIVMDGNSRQAFFVLLIRAVPLMPFMLGSYVIAMLPSVSKSTIVGFSILGCYLYYAYFGAGFFFGAITFGSSSI